MIEFDILGREKTTDTRHPPVMTTITPEQPRNSKPTAIDLFCGSGGVSLGLRRAGFNVVGAVDFDQSACETYRTNHPDVLLLEEDIKKASPKQFAKLIEKQLDLLAICAPCQPFSSQNKTRSSNDARKELILAAIPFVKRLNPKAIFVENVPGLKKNSVFDQFIASLEKLGYSISDPLKLNASQLGVPQRRTRMVMIATKGISLEVASTLPKRKLKTVRSVIGQLPPPPIGMTSDATDSLHFSRRHSPLNIERLRHIPKDGGGREALPLHLQLQCHKNKKASSFSDTYGRMRWDDVAPTLTTGCTDITRGRFAHPEQNRAITLREAARLQSFPDHYKFVGGISAISAQIGNAVPPEMMRTIGRALRKALREAQSE